LSTARWALDPQFRIPVNRSVVEFIERANPSAHSDVASALIDAAKGLRDVRHYCPDSARYAYVVLHTGDHVIFGLAYGMNALALRVGADDVERGVADRGWADAELGEGWVRFDPFAVDEPTKVTRDRLRRWCARAHEWAGGER
jgi:hypothetical protein